MTAEDHENLILQKKGVKPTANRLLTLRELRGKSHPVSLHDLEAALYPMDKSSIFRVLNVFVKNHVVHAIEDGSGIMKYEFCSGEDGCTLKDMHVHFYCEACGETYCFPAIHIPEIRLPEGFEIDSITYMVKGRCPRCRK